jgi:hypothetical protein
MFHLLDRVSRRLARNLFSAVSGLLLVIGSAPAEADAGQNRETFEAVREADLTLATIGWRLAVSNAALCDRLEPGIGLQLHTLDQFDPASRTAAQTHFEFATPVAVEGVIAGSPAERAGIHRDDSLVRVGSVDIAALPGKPETTQRLVATQLAIASLPPSAPIEVEAIRAGAPIKVTIQPVPACRSRFELLLSSGYNARADGTMVQISSQFLEEYTPDQVAAAVAHEFSRLVRPDAARVVDDLVAALVERDRFEHVVIDQHDQQVAASIAVSISIRPPRCRRTPSAGRA